VYVFNWYACVLEVIFPGRPLGEFSKILGDKSGDICFFPFEIKKTSFFAEIFKIQGTHGFLFWLPCWYAIMQSHLLLFFESVAKLKMF